MRPLPPFLRAYPAPFIGHFFETASGMAALLGAHHGACNVSETC